MSVLVEAVCAIIRKEVLEVAYPGGTEAFLAHSSRRSAEHRYICVDAHLVCLSYFSAAAADRGIVPLVQAGMTDIRDNEFIDIAFVDQHSGPMLQCTWLTWDVNPAGYTCVWLTGELPGELSTPHGWKPGDTRRLSHFDIRDFPDKAIKLADEDGVQTWLDFTTGRIMKRMSKQY